MADFFLKSPWPGLVAWSLLYISDFVLTVTCARLYKRGVADQIAFEGSYELNPLFQKDIDSLNFFSPRFLAMLALTALLIVILWVLSTDSPLPLYTFALGAVISVQLAIHIRHWTNLFLFRSVIAGDGVRGRIEYARPLIFRMSSVGLLSFAALYAALFVFVRSWFLAGGAVACLFAAGKHALLSRRAARRAAVSPPQSSPAPQ